MAKGPDSQGTPETIDDVSRRASVEPAAVPAPPVFTLEVVATSHYDLEGEQGRGGLGRVLRAYDRRLDRVVAVKELLRPDARARERFLREVRITAKLQHPGIVPVHEAGQWPSGEPFYAMKLVEGQTLRERLEKTKSLADRLALLPNLIVVADAMAYAHSKDVIHRDLKPSNIVVGRFGETVVIDWGLAKILSHADDDPSPASGSPESGEQTQLGEVIGTPSYMAPEQAAGAVVDKRTDVYALGSILYHLIAGRAPFDISGRRVADEPPPDLRDLAPETPRDLLAIVAKAMEPELPHRYQDAAAFAEDLRRFQNGQLVSVRQYTARELMVRWIRRHRAIVAIAAVATVVLLMVSVVAFLRIVESERLARLGQRAAEEQRNELILSNARAALATDPTLAAAWVKRYPRNGANRAGLEQVIADAQNLGVARHVIQTEGSPFQLAFAADSKLLVFAQGGSPIRVWDVRAGFERPSVGAAGALSFNISQQQESMVYLEGGRRASFTSLRGQPRGLPCGDWVSAVALSPDGATAACASLRDGTIVLFDSHDIERRRLPLPNVLRDEITAAIFSATGRYLFLTATNGGLVRLDRVNWEVRTSQLPRGADYLAASATDATLLVGDPTGALWRWDADSQSVTAVAPNATKLGWSSSGKYVAAAQSDGAIVVLSDDGSEVRRHEGQFNVTALTLSDDGRFVVAGYRDGSIGFWDEASGAEVIYHGHPAKIIKIALSPDGAWLASAGYDTELRIWPRPQFPIRTIRARPGRIYLANTPYEASLDGRYFAGTLVGGVKLWDLEAGVPLRETTLEGEPGPTRLFFSLDSKLLIVAGRLGIYGLEVPSGRLLWRHLVASSIEQVSMSSDRTELVAATSAGFILHLHLGTTIVRDELDRHKASVWRISSIQAGRFASVDVAGRILLWDLTDGSSAPLAVVSSDTIRFLELSRGIVFAMGERTIYAWRVDGTAIVSWRSPTLLGWCSIESREQGGTRAVFSDTEGTVRAWSPGSASPSILRLGDGVPAMVESFAPHTIATLSTNGLVAVGRAEVSPEPEYRLRTPGDAYTFLMLPHLGLFAVQSQDGVISFYSYFDPLRRDGLDPWQRAEALTTFVDVGSN